MLVSGVCDFCGVDGAWEGGLFRSKIDAVTRPKDWAAAFPWNMDVMPEGANFRPESCEEYNIETHFACPKCWRGKGKPGYVLAKVYTPRYEPDRNRLLIPLVHIPDTAMMEATICYTLLQFGYSMKEVRQLRRIPREWTAKAIQDHVRTHGRAVYPETEYAKGLSYYERVEEAYNGTT